MARNYVISEGSSIIEVKLDYAYYRDSWPSEKINYYTKEESNNRFVLVSSLDGDIVTTNGQQDIFDKTIVSPILNGALTGNAISNDPQFLANSSTKVPTQQAVLALYNTVYDNLSQNQVVFTNGSSKLTSLGYTDALNTLLPNQFGNAGKFLASDGVNAVWRENSSIHIEVVSSPTAQLTPNSMVVMNYPVPSDLTLPLTANVGESIEIVGGVAGGWRILQNTGQQIFVGDRDSTMGVSGYVESTHYGDCIKLVCISQNVGWRAVTSTGNLNIE